MKLKCFTIYDSVADAYHRPFFSPSVPVCLRSIKQEMNNSPIGQSPGDYTLFEIGQFDEQTGEFEKNKTLVKICLLHDLVDTDNQKPFSVVGE